MSTVAASGPAPACTRVALGELLVSPPQYRGHPHGGREAAALYSLAAFGRGHPEELPARPSRKPCVPVQPGDVLVSRAVAEPRRAWMVVGQDGRMLLASAEWLVLRSPRHHPGYLRHVLVSNAFQLRFLQALAGARQANPASARLRALDVPQPALAEQQAIARLLDLADTLRSKRRRALAALDAIESVLQDEAQADILAGIERLRGRMNASRLRLDALLGVLRDRAYLGLPLVR